MLQFKMYHLVLGLCLLTLTSTHAAKTDLRPIFTTTEIETLRTAIRGSETALVPVVRALRKRADESLQQGPWSVTFRRPKGLELPAGDFFSEAPYWWADPNNPQRPYIRKDGQRNPDRLTANEEDLRAMAYATLTLAMGARFLEEPRYARHAAKVLETWFIDPTSRPLFASPSFGRYSRSDRLAGVAPVFRHWRGWH
jgi:hypothetical protein